MAEPVKIGCLDRTGKAAIRFGLMMGHKTHRMDLIGCKFQEWKTLDDFGEQW